MNSIKKERRRQGCVQIKAALLYPSKGGWVCRGLPGPAQRTSNLINKIVNIAQLLVGHKHFLHIV